MEGDPYEPPKTTEPLPQQAPKRRGKAWWDYVLVVLVGGIFGLGLVPFFWDFMTEREAIVAAFLTGAVLGLAAYRFVP